MPLLRFGLMERDRRLFESILIEISGRYLRVCDVEAYLGIRELFKKRVQDKVVGTKVLLASLDSKFAELVKADSECYSQFYPIPAEIIFDNSNDLLGAIGKGYDIVHLFCDVSSNGNIRDRKRNETAGAVLIQACSRSDVKLLWLASENKPEGYIKGFKIAAGKPLNLVLTIDRKGSHFPVFLSNLLRKMSAGETMPVAWVSISPQSPKDPRNQDAPVCIFAAGRAGVKLR
jgi:hypothetical protein